MITLDTLFSVLSSDFGSIQSSNKSLFDYKLTYYNISFEIKGGSYSIRVRRNDENEEILLFKGDKGNILLSPELNKSFSTIVSGLTLNANSVSPELKEIVKIWSAVSFSSIIFLANPPHEIYKNAGDTFSIYRDVLEPDNSVYLCYSFAGSGNQIYMKVLLENMERFFDNKINLNGLLLNNKEDFVYFEIKDSNEVVKIPKLFINTFSMAKADIYFKDLPGAKNIRSTIGNEEDDPWGEDWSIENKWPTLDSIKTLTITNLLHKILTDNNEDPSEVI